MLTPSPEIIQVVQTFAPVFTRPTFAHACTLVAGTILAVGARTVTAALRAARTPSARRAPPRRSDAQPPLPRASPPVRLADTGSSPALAPRPWQSSDARFAPADSGHRARPP